MSSTEAKRPVVIVDTETTSLTPDYAAGTGVIWELAVIDRQRDAESLWRVKPDLAKADPRALEVGRYYDRTAAMCEKCRPDRVRDLTRTPGSDPEWSLPLRLASHVARLLNGATLVAANPAFDAGFLTAFLRYHGEAPTWHYRLRDIGSMAWGWLAANRAEGVTGYGLPPVDASTDVFALALGVDPAGFERHSALGDCRLVAAMLDVIEGGAS